MLFTSIKVPNNISKDNFNSSVKSGILSKSLLENKFSLLKFGV